jgi:hypothetical protein
VGTASEVKASSLGTTGGGQLLKLASLVILAGALVMAAGLLVAGVRALRKG